MSTNKIYLKTISNSVQTPRLYKNLHLKSLVRKRRYSIKYRKHNRNGSLKQYGACDHHSQYRMKNVHEQTGKRNFARDEKDPHAL